MSNAGPQTENGAPTGAVSEVYPHFNRTTNKEHQSENVNGESALAQLEKFAAEAELFFTHRVAAERGCSWAELSDEERERRVAEWPRKDNIWRIGALARIAQHAKKSAEAAPVDAPEPATPREIAPAGSMKRFPSSTVHRPPSSAIPNKKRRMLHNQRTHEAALAYAAIGLPVVDVHSIDDDGQCTCQWGRQKAIDEGRKPPTPCGTPGKHPRGRSWQNDATTDPEHIKARWGDKPYYVNVGVVFGGKTGFVLIEGDGPDGAATLEQWRTEKGLPDSLACISGSGGTHLYYRVPLEWDIRNSVKIIGAGVDARGEHGFAVGVGSRHLSGFEAGWKDGVGVYKSGESQGVGVGEITDAPVWLLRKMWFATKDRRHATAPDGSKWEDAGLAEPTTGAASATAEDDDTPNPFAGIGAAGSSEGSWEDKIELIGHGNGLKSFDGQIYKAACSYFGLFGHETDAALLKTKLLERIAIAPVDKPGHRDRYLSDDYLNPRIEQGRDYVKSKGGEADRSYRASTPDPDAPPPAQSFASVAAMNAVIDALTPESDDVDLKSIMRSMYVSAALDDAARRMAVRRIAHQVTTGDELDGRDMLYIKRMWEDVSWLMMNPKPPSLSEPDVVARFMSSRYVAIRWGKDFGYVDILQPKMTPYSGASLVGEYNDTAVLLPDDKGVPKPFPNWFKWWSSRAKVKHYDMPVFVPKGYVAERALNLYRGDAVKAIDGDWSLFRRHLFENVCDRNAAKFAFLICTLAGWVQAPQKKMGVAIVLRGVKGCGKTKVGEWICELFPHNSSTLSSSEEVKADFNIHLAYSIVVIVNEAFWAGDKAAEGKLKAMITDGKQFAHPKGMDRAEIDDCRHFIFTSNEDWVVPATAGERRFLVLDVSPQHAKDTDYFAAIDKQMEAGGLEAMKYDLLNLVIPDCIDLRNPPVTDALQEQIEHSASGYDAAWQTFLENGWIDLPVEGVNYGTPERVTWHADRGLSVDRDRFRAALDDEVERLRGRLKNDVALGIWLKAKCGAGVNTRAARAREVYDLPPRREVARLAGVDLDANASASGAHRLKLPDTPSESWIERPDGSRVAVGSAAGLRRLHLLLGFDGTIEVPDKWPLSMLSAFAWWGIGGSVHKRAAG